MATATDNGSDVLCAEILAEARRQSDAMLRSAAEQAAKIQSDAAAEAEAILRQRRDLAQVEAKRKRELILATVAAEAVRMRAARIEAIMESLRQEILRTLRLREFDIRETIVWLAVEAIQGMAGNEFLLKIAAADQSAFGEGLTDEIAKQLGRPSLRLSVSADMAVVDGVIVKSADRRQIWDNQLDSRLERLWPQLRSQIAVGTGLAGENHVAGGGV